MKCKFCTKETTNEYQVCDDCENTLTIAINKNRRKMARTKIASQKSGITSLVCGIIAMATPLGFLPSFICGIVAIIFAKVAKNTDGAQLGQVGKTVGIVGMISCVIKLICNLIILAASACLITLLVIISLTLFK